MQWFCIQIFLMALTLHDHQKEEKKLFWRDLVHDPHSHFNNGKPSPALNWLASPHMSIMPAKLKALPVTIVAPGVAHVQSHAEDALASALSGLESATTEWPGLQMWPCGVMTLDDALDEVAATLLRKDALTKTGSAESAVADRAPMCDKHTHPSVLCLTLPSRLLLDLTVSGAAEHDQVVGGWDANASGNQCCNIPRVVETCTDDQAFGPTVPVLNVHDKIEASPRLHQGPRKYTCTIGSATALRLLHIPIHMHRQLGLSDIYPLKAAGRRTGACSLILATMADKAAVVMVRTISKGQRHRRFSTGWREFCARAGVDIGDELVFERTGTWNELAVRVVKAGLSKARRGQ